MSDICISVSYGNLSNPSFWRRWCWSVKPARQRKVSADTAADWCIPESQTHLGGAEKQVRRGNGQASPTCVTYFWPLRALFFIAFCSLSLAGQEIHCFTHASICPESPLLHELPSQLRLRKVPRLAEKHGVVGAHEWTLIFTRFFFPRWNEEKNEEASTRHFRSLQVCARNFNRN